MNAATTDFIRQHGDDDVRQLALRPMPEGVDRHAALTQIEGRQLAARKIPSWAAADGLLFPPRLSLEQCSSEATAQYKRRVVGSLVQGAEAGSAPERKASFSFVDLTGGLGVDFAALAPLFAEAIYAERNEELCQLARHNLPLLACGHAHVRCTTAETLLEALCGEPPRHRIIMLDPARRDAAGRKVALIEDCTPDVCRLQGQLRVLADYTLIKLSPMLDITAAVRALKGITEIHVVSVEGECKELIAVMAGASREDAAVASPIIHCVNLPSDTVFSFHLAEEREAAATLAESLGTYLYEPNASILKAGAFRSICARYPVAKLSAEAHLYTASVPLDDFPGRRWRIVDYATFNKQELKRLLAGIPAADLTVRGFPMSVAVLRRQLRLREGGQHHLIATTIGNQKCLISVERLTSH